MAVYSPRYSHSEQEQQEQASTDEEEAACIDSPPRICRSGFISIKSPEPRISLGNIHDGPRSELTPLTSFDTEDERYFLK